MALKCLFLMFFVVSTILGLASAQNGFLPENVTLPSEFKEKVDEKQIEKLQNKTKEHFKTKCEQNGGPEAYEKAQNASANLIKCMQGLIDMSMLQAEIENAKPNGNVDEVFKKYCAKKENFMGCAKHMLETTKPCFSAAEQANIKIVQNVTEQLAEFICYKDGDRIALFIAEGGQECFEDKRDEIQECSKSVFGLDVDLGLQLDNITSENMPELTFDKQQCDQLSRLQLCVVDVLGKCPKPTSANILESLFKFIRNGTPCKQYPVVKAVEATKPGSANGLSYTSFTIVMAAVAALYL